jgi:hypothetical protein
MSCGDKIRVLVKGSSRLDIFRCGGDISALVLGLIVLPFYRPAFPIDPTALGLAGLAVLRWLTLFFKKFKVPGIIEGEAQNRTQGISLPTPSQMVAAINEKAREADSAARFKSLPPTAQKILRTLWR